MAYYIDFLPEVEQDVQNAYDWYQEQLYGLGEDFLLTIDASINGIVRNPLLHEKIFGQVRKVKPKRFPFGIFYIVAKGIITITAIVHLSRHPRSWKKRIRKR